MKKFLNARASLLIALLLVALTLSCVGCKEKETAQQDTSTEEIVQNVESTDSSNTQEGSETTKPSGGSSQNGTQGGDDDAENEPNNSNSDKGPTANDLPIIWG